MASADVTRALQGSQHHEPVRHHYRPMRGQAYVRLEEPHQSSILHLLPGRPDEEKIHRGTVLDLGDPARIGEWDGAPECPWDLRIGDVVYFHLAVWLDRMRILEFLGVEGRVAVLAQVEIVAVEGVHERPTIPELPRFKDDESEDCDAEA